jgi:hypothetical protein
MGVAVDGGAIGEFVFAGDQLWLRQRMKSPSIASRSGCRQMEQVIVVQGFLVGVPFVGEIHYGFFFAEAGGFEELESDGEGWYTSSHGERPPFGREEDRRSALRILFLKNSDFLWSQLQAKD